jgi:hypothetical protein
LDKRLLDKLRQASSSNQKKLRADKSMPEIERNKSIDFANEDNYGLQKKANALDDSVIIKKKISFHD